MPRTHRPSRGGIIKGGCSRGAGIRGVTGGCRARAAVSASRASQEKNSEEKVVLEAKDVRARLGTSSLVGVWGFMFVMLRFCYGGTVVWCMCE